MPHHWLLVANPSAHSGQAAAHVEAAAAALRRHGLEVTPMATRPGGVTPGMVAEALRAGAFDGVVAMGGDGTFHEVANGLLRSGRDLPFGLIPAGTGNNQARALGLPVDDVAAAAAIVAQGRLAPLDGIHLQAWDDLGVALPELWAFDSIGFGFSARALLFRFEDKAQVEQLPLLRELYRDELVYAGAAVRALLGTYLEDHRFDAWVARDGGEPVYLEDLHDLIVNNTRYYARAWVLDPTSRHDDGLVEILPIHGMDEWAVHAVVDLDGSPLRDWLEQPEDAALSRAARFEVELHDRPLEPHVPAQADGEPWGPVRRVRGEVVRGVLKVRVAEPTA